MALLIVDVFGIVQCLVEILLLTLVSSGEAIEKCSKYGKELFKDMEFPEAVVATPVAATTSAAARLGTRLGTTKAKATRVTTTPTKSTEDKMETREACMY